MNAQRRKEIEEVLNELADLRSRVDAIHGEEQDAYDNMPEGLKASERGQASEAAASALDPDGHPNSPAYGHLKLPHLN